MLHRSYSKYPPVRVEAFYLDTSILSNSLISRPSLDDPTADRLRRYTRDQFGPPNTGDFDSHAVALRRGYPSRGLALVPVNDLTNFPVEIFSGRQDDSKSIAAHPVW